MDKKQAYKLIERRIKGMIPDIEKTLLERAQHILHSGVLSEEDFERFLGDRGDTYALTKAIITSWFNDKPYEPPKHLTEYVELFNRLGYV